MPLVALIALMVAAIAATAVVTLLVVTRRAEERMRAVTEAHARRREAVATLRDGVLGATPTGELFAHAMALATTALDVAHGELWTWEAGDRRLALRAGVGWRAGHVGRAFVDVGGRLPATAVLTSPSPVVIDLATDPRAADARLHREHGLARAAAVVVGSHAKPVGVLAVYAPSTDRLGAGDVEFLESIASVLAIAVDRERADRALAEEMQASAALALAGRELIASLQVPVLLERLCRVATDVLACDQATAWLLQPDGKAFAPAAACGLPADEWEAVGALTVPAASFADLLAELAREEVVQVAEDGEASPLLAGILGRLGARHTMLIAIRRGDDVVGLAASGWRERREPCAPHEERIAIGLGQLASMALTNGRLVEELERASQLKSEFVSTMSHELRTPLNVIIGYTDMLRDGLTPQQQAPLLALMRRSSLELLEMIDATLNLNRIAAGGDQPRFEPTSLPGLWEELRGDFAAMPRRTEAELRWDDPCDVEVVTDRRKLKIVLKNLVGNALKFTADGEVVASCAVDETGCTFVVRDSGVGIPPEHLPHIFDMFRQVDSSEARSYGGAGLGLYIVRSLLAQLGGEVTVTSTVDRGSTFTVRLPLRGPDGIAAGIGAARGDEGVGMLAHEMAEAERQLADATAVIACTADVGATALASTAGARKQILFADDLPLNRFLLRRFLANEVRDVDVIEACDGEQAVAMAEVYHPDLVLLDLRMPSMDGWQAARRIRALPGGATVPIIALSVDASPYAESRALAAGCNEFLAKPVFDYGTLKARIEHWLERETVARPRRGAGPVCVLCRRDLVQANPV